MADKTALRGKLASPIAVLREATSRYPALRYAWAVVGMGAAVAIIKGFGLSGPATLFAIVALLALMGVMVVFQTFASSRIPGVKLLALVFGWTTLIAFAVVVFLLISTVFWGFPKPFTELVGESLPVVTPVVTTVPCGADSVRFKDASECSPSDFFRIDMNRMELGLTKDGWHLVTEGAVVPTSSRGLVILNISITARATLRGDGTIVYFGKTFAENTSVTSQPFILARRDAAEWIQMGRPASRPPKPETHHFEFEIDVEAKNVSDGRPVWLTLKAPILIPMTCDHFCIVAGPVSASGGANVRLDCDWMPKEADDRWQLSNCMVPLATKQD